MSKPRILLQLDTDEHASSFDAVVAIDSGVEQLLQYSGVTVDNVEPLVHGAIFTRGANELNRTAIFVGGSDVVAASNVLDRVRAAFFGPMRVSVMMDANGANTTAAAAVMAAAEQLELADAQVLVLAATGPVGQRAVRLLTRAGAAVRVASRSLNRAEQVCSDVRQRYPDADLTPLETGSERALRAAAGGVHAVIAAGAAGVQLMSADLLQGTQSLRVAIDLNAVPPFGLEGVDVMDKAATHGSLIGYGAVGVGGTKMKIHKAAVRGLFESNDRVLDAEEIFAIGKGLAK